MRYIALASFLVASIAMGGDLSDTEIRDVMIRESLSQYSGPCPCPYNTMRNGRRCGGRSAYSKPGGYSPLCYPRDISDNMIKAYRKKHSK